MAGSANLAVARAALAAIHAPTTSNEARRQAHAALAEFMSSLTPEASFQAAQQLLIPLMQGQPLSSDTETLLGFQLLDEKILQVPPWIGHSEELRADVRKLSVALVTHASPRHYKKYVVVKAAALVVALAVREWPQQWPTFVDDLLGGNLPQQVVCAVLRILSEEVYEFYSSIDIFRRSELTAEMVKNLPKMLTYITSSANHFVSTSDSPGLSTAIAAIEAFMTWAPLSDIFSASLPTACIALLQNAEFSSAALSALNVLVQRKDPRIEAKTHPGFRQEVFPRLLEFASSGPLSSIQALSYVRPAGLFPGAVQAFERCSYQQDANLVNVDPDQHEFMVGFMSMFAQLGTANFITAFMPANEGGAADTMSQSAAAAYIDIMLSASASPSMAIRSAVLPFFTHVLSSFNKILERQKLSQRLSAPVASRPPVGITKLILDGMKTPFVRDMMETLVRRYVNTASLAMTNWPNDQLLAAYAEVDYNGDNGQMSDQAYVLRGRTVSNIGIAAKFHPSVILPLALGRLMDVLTKANSVAWVQDGKSGTGLKVNGKLPYVLGFISEEQSPRGWTFGSFNATQSKEMEAALEAAVLSTEAVLAGISSTRCLETDADSYRLLEKLFEVVMGLTHPNLYAAKITALRMFIPIFKKDSRALEACLKSLGSIIESSKKSTISYQACNSLASICRRLRRAKAGGLQAFLAPLCTFAVQAHEKDDYAVGERNLLLEAAIAVTLSFGTVAEQTPTIEKLLAPLFGVLDRSRLKSVHDPEPLYNFMETAPESEHTYSCLRSLEAAVHQVARVKRNRHGPTALLTPLTPNIAPWMVKVGAPLVTAIHGLYNPNEFRLAGRDKKRTSILLPTSREIAYLLNLDGSAAGAAWNNSPITGSFADGKEENPEQAKSALERCDDLLARFEIPPPDPKYSAEREYLKGLRFAGYELLRAAILSGICQSHTQTTLIELLNAVCSHRQYLEPIHLHYLLNKVVKHLLSFQVTSGHDEFLAIVNESQIPELLHIVRATVEASNVQNGELASSLASLDVARDHGRKMVARSAADMLAAMFPKDGLMESAAVYLPSVFGHAKLAESLGGLWDVLCVPSRGVSDNGASRVALVLLGRAVDAAPANATALYMGRLEKCLSTAAQSDGMGSDSPMEPAIGAILSYFKKWPTDSVKEILRILGNMPAEFLEIVAKKLEEIMKTSATRNARLKLRSLIRLISQKAGLSVRKQASVQALPRPPVTRRPRAPPSSLEGQPEVVLGDRALDSLFGGGDPL